MSTRHIKQSMMLCAPPPPVSPALAGLGEASTRPSTASTALMMSVRKPATSSRGARPRALAR